MLWGAYYRVHTTSVRIYADHLEKSQTHLWSDKKITSHLKWATAYESLLMPYANNKDTNQPANLRSLISAFVVRCLDSTISLVFCICNFMSLVCFCSWAGGLSLTWSQTSEDRFSRDVAQIILPLTLDFLAIQKRMYAYVLVIIYLPAWL